MRPVTTPQQHTQHFHVPQRLLVLMAALVAFGAATFLLISLLDEDSTSGGPGVVVPAITPSSEPGVRYDGGPEEGSALQTRPAPGVRPDGGPSEGAAASAIAPSVVPSVTRYDGGPEEGSAAITPSAVAPTTRYDGGPEEGSAEVSGSSSSSSSVPSGPAADRFHHDLP